MIQLYHVTKTYPPKSQALTDVNLEIGKGEFVFLAGPSGAGKTTLLKLLFREEELTEGRILLDGKNITRLSGRGVARLRRELGLVFQEFKLLPRLSALENVALAAEVVGIPRRESHTKAYQLLRELGLRDRYDAKPLALSGGEQQRVALARAFVTRPSILFADEPTGNLDSKTGSHSIDLLFELNHENNTTLILVTHDQALAARCQRTIKLDAGRIVAN